MPNRKAWRSARYESAHSVSDTLCPREEWEHGQRDLEVLTEQFRSLADRFTAELRFNLSPKHPCPARVLTKRIRGKEVEIRLYLGPDKDDPESRYHLEVFRSWGGGLFGLGPTQTDWTPISVYRQEEFPQRAREVGITVEKLAVSEFEEKGAV